MPGRGFRSYPPRAVAGGFVLMILSTYLSIVTGFVSETIGNIIGARLSTDSLTVVVTGARTDLFWNSSVERVYVTDVHGLEVDVRGARVEGALHSFLLFRRVRSVTVEDLLITVPRPRERGEPATLVRILANIDRGIMTGADSVILYDGTISDSAGPILDGMQLSASVVRGRGADVTAARASTWIREVGTVSGSGHASLEDGVASSRGFSASTPFGNMYFEGTLTGATSALDVSFSGVASAGEELLRVPVEAELDFSGDISGTLSHPEVSTSLRNGVARAYGHPLEFAVDTLDASLDSLSLEGLMLAGAGLRIASDCSYRFADGIWRVSLQSAMSSFDPSVLSSSAPEADLNGVVSAELSGTQTGLSSCSGTVDLETSVFSGIPVTSLNAILSARPGRWDLTAAAAAPGLTADLDASGTSGMDLVPSTYTGRLSFSVEDASMLPLLTLPESLSIVDAACDVAFSGNRSSVSAEFDAGVGGIALGTGLGAAGLVMGGAASWSGSPRGSAEIRIDSLRTPLDTFQVGASLAFGDGEYSLTDLQAVSPAGMAISATAVYREGDPAMLLVDGLRVGSSKQRIVQDGSIICIFDSSSVSLDTAWVQTPHGTLALQGEVEGASSDFELTGRRVDLSQLGGLLHLGGAVSGYGEFDAYMRTEEGVTTAGLDGRITGPSFGAYQADSITLDLDMADGDLSVTGISSWDGGVASTLKAYIEDVMTPEGFSMEAGNIVSAELMLNRLGDWVFYALPVPLRTRGADISARLEYSRDAEPGQRITVEAVASIERLFITSLNMYLSNVVMHLQPDPGEYGTRLTLSSADSTRGTIMATLLLDIDQDSLPDISLDGFSFRADFDSFRASIGGFANIMFSGYLKSESRDPTGGRPEVTGKLEILEGIIGMPQDFSTGGAAQPEPLPVDLRITIWGERGLWFRSSLADIEMNLDLSILTQQGMPVISGTLSSARGKVHLLQKDFDITEGTVEFLPGVPSEQRLSITAVTVVRGAIDRMPYTITVIIQGTPSSPLITLSGEGPSGSLTQEDILSLLAVGITYGELQQMDSGALQTQLGGAAQNYVGQLLARSLRDGVGLDQLELTPDLLADSTSLTLNIGKYVLPDLFVSFSGDIFSSEPGTISAQYYIQPDLYLVGSTKSTIHGEQEPSLELHYTLRY